MPSLSVTTLDVATSRFVFESVTDAPTMGDLSALSITRTRRPPADCARALEAKRAARAVPRNRRRMTGDSTARTASTTRAFVLRSVGPPDSVDLTLRDAAAPLRRRLERRSP